MTYDDWKLMTPDEDRDFRRGGRHECDVCGSWVRRLHAVTAYGIETYACDACVGAEEVGDE